MNNLKKVISFLLLAAALVVAAPQAPAQALVGDPVITVVTSPSVVVAGQPVTFTVTISQPGYTPYGQKITWRNPRTFATLNVANSTVIPVTYADGVWTYRYTPSGGEVGRTETFSVVTSVSAARIPRTVSGFGYFTVTA